VFDAHRGMVLKAAAADDAHRRCHVRLLDDMRLERAYGQSAQITIAGGRADRLSNRTALALISSGN
jgi:hypothetical protein